MKRRFLIMTMLSLVLGATVGAGVLSNTRTAAAVPLPPFRQCPTVRVDTSCEVLIVYNSDGSRDTLVDSTQPPYDLGIGSEDTLIGVQNNSTSSVSSTPVQGAGITGFDGDGLCASSITPHPAGCPYGSTGYEGRGSTTSTASTAAGGGDSFTVIDANHAIVNFSPAIPPGGSAYFSLEGPATSISRPTTVTLSPLTAINPVSTNHTVTATVKDQNGALMGGVTVHFTVTGSVTTTGTCVTTLPTGTCDFTYQGPILPGTDAITGCAGASADPCGAATKVWVLPVSSPLCTIDITQGGWMIANNGDKVSFGGTVHTDQANAPSGQEQYTDKPATLDVHSINILAITCSANLELADIYGTATINGSGSFNFRIEVTDPDSTSGNDTYWIVLANGYNSGSHPLGGGHVEIHHT